MKPCCEPGYHPRHPSSYRARYRCLDPTEEAAWLSLIELARVLHSARKPLNTNGLKMLSFTPKALFSQRDASRLKIERGRVDRTMEAREFHPGSARIPPNPLLAIRQARYANVSFPCASHRGCCELRGLDDEQRLPRTRCSCLRGCTGGSSPATAPSLSGDRRRRTSRTSLRRGTVASISKRCTLSPNAVEMQRRAEEADANFREQGFGRQYRDPGES